LLHGLAPLPQADSRLRAELDARAARQGWPALHAELARLDPEAAARVAPTDSQRIQRALEVCYNTGRPISELQRATVSPLAVRRGVAATRQLAKRQLTWMRGEALGRWIEPQAGLSWNRDICNLLAPLGL